MLDAPNNESVERPRDFGEDGEALARRWKLELQLSDKRDVKWREEARLANNIYASCASNYSDKRANSFNILWTNTETLHHAVYNSPPAPRCKRRYDDEDPLGFQTANVLTRALEYTLDCTNFSEESNLCVLSMLLPGRGVLWETYEPTISQDEFGNEFISDEKSVSEFVQFDDFRILCNAKTWSQVTAIGRRYKLNRDDLIERFGKEIGERIPLNTTNDDDVNKSPESNIFKTADVWQIWDKDTKRVIYITQGLQVPCKVEDDPLRLTGFFPTPNPMYAISNAVTLEPTLLYSQYKPQAMELNRVSGRINALINTLRVRGIYDATLTELNQLMKVGDDHLVPSQAVRSLIERGGLEKAIWMMPIDTAAMVLKELYAQREATKQVIYEITGISDIMRAATDPKETFGAQRIKTQWGTQRLQKMQKEVQRYFRDIIRIKAEIVSKFQPEKLMAMTLIKLPRRAEVQAQMQQAMMQYQQAAAQAMQQGQQPPPPPQLPPPPITWEDVIEQLQNDKLREYHIDIETDSTIAATQDSDMAGLRETLTGISEVIRGLGPAVQAGAMPVDVVKQLIGVVVRRAKMGSAIEEAIDKIKQPPPGVDPEQSKMQQKQMELQQQQAAQQAQYEHEAKLEQLKMQNQLAIEQAQAQGDAQREQARLEADAQIDQIRAQTSIAAEEAKLRAKYAMDEQELQHKAALSELEKQNESLLSARTLEFEQWKTEFEAATKIVIAQIQAQSAMDQKVVTIDQKLHEAPAPKEDKKIDKLTDMHAKTLDAITGVMQQLSKPRKIKRDADGRAEGIE